MNWHTFTNNRTEASIISNCANTFWGQSSMLACIRYWAEWTKPRVLGDRKFAVAAAKFHEAGSTRAQAALQQWQWAAAGWGVEKIAQERSVTYGVMRPRKLEAVRKWRQVVVWLVE